jgi:hypothetical protein
LEKLFGPAALGICRYPTDRLEFLTKDFGGTMRPPILFLVLAAFLASAVTPAHAQKSQSMSMNCAGTQRSPDWNAQHPHQTPGEAWVAEALKPFLPKPGAAPSLRFESLEWTSVQAVAAYDGIRQVCASYLAGNTPQDVADNTLAGFEQTLRDFVRSASNEIQVMAAGGDVAQLEEIRNAFIPVAEVGRQAALLGDKATADAAHDALFSGLKNFNSTFKDKCYEESFDPQIALELNLQDIAAGNGIDVSDCAKRKFKAFVPANYLFESCTIYAVGDWRVTWDFGYMGRPQSPLTFPLGPGAKKSEATYSVDWGQNGVVYTTAGEATLTVNEQRDAKGNLIKREYKLSGKHSISLTKGAARISQLSKLMGKTPRRGQGSYNVDVNVSEKPCKSIDDTP